MPFKILPFFGRKTEKETIELFHEHLYATVCTRDGFGQALQAFFKSDFKAVEKYTKKVKNCERNADIVRRKIATHLFQGAFLPNMRSNLYKLSDMLDDVPDKIQDATNILFYLKGRKIPKKAMEFLVDLGQHASLSIDLLNQNFDSLIENSGSFNDDITRMKKCEESSDNTKREFFKFIYAQKKMDPVTVELLGRLGHTLSKITDAVDDTCNHMSLIKVLRQA